MAEISEPDRTAALAREIVANEGRVGARGATLALAEAYLALVAENTRRATAINDALTALRRWESAADDDEQFIMDALAALAAVAPPPPQETEISGA